MMVIIEREAESTFDITLTELVTINAPYYLFAFTNKTTNEVSTCFLTDTSAYTERFNRFTLSEPSDVVLIPGDYIYRVYQKAANTSEAIPTTGLLETGIARVPITALTETEFESTLNIAPLVYESTD